MNQSLHLTDDEALDSLLRCVKHQGEEEVSTVGEAIEWVKARANNCVGV